MGVALGLSSAAVGAFAYSQLGVERKLEIVFEMELRTDRPATGQLFWDAADGEAASVPAMWTESKTRFFKVRPGPASYRLDLPVGTRAVRLDPMATPGAIAFRTIELVQNGIRLRRWDAERGFGGWEPASDLGSVRVEGGWLRMEATGPDPFLVTRGLSRLRAERLKVHAALAVLLALLWLGAQAALVLPALRAAPSPAPAANAPPSRTGRPLATAALALGSTLLAGSAAWIAYRTIVRPAAGKSPVVGGLEYEPTIVDRAGRPLSTKPGGLKVMFDPYTLYRNLPGQRTATFTTDRHGWRGGFDAGAARPRAVVLGGSAAFGLRLGSDGETFAARLGALDARYEFVNAGVVGFLSGQELAEMVHYTDAIGPRLYVVFDGWNELLQLPDLKAPGATDSLGYNRPIFRTLEERLRQHATEDMGPDEVASVVVRESAALDHATALQRVSAAYLDNLGRMATFARAREADLLVVFQPQLGAKRHHTPTEAQEWRAWQDTYGALHPTFADDYEALLHAARAFCTQAGIAWLDLSRAPEFVDERRELFLDAVHPNAQGHQVLAERIAQALRETATARRTPGSH